MVGRGRGCTEIFAAELLFDGGNWGCRPNLPSSDPGTRSSSTWYVGYVPR